MTTRIAPSSEDDDDNYFHEGPYCCQRCQGEGVIVTCIDDLCYGNDYCIHGDGYGTCPDCKGVGQIMP